MWTVIGLLASPRQYRAPKHRRRGSTISRAVLQALHQHCSLTVGSRTAMTSARSLLGTQMCANLASPAQPNTLRYLSERSTALNRCLQHVQRSTGSLASTPRTPVDRASMATREMLVTAMSDVKRSVLTHLLVMGYIGAHAPPVGSQTRAVSV